MLKPNNLRYADDTAFIDESEKKDERTEYKSWPSTFKKCQQIMSINTKTQKHNKNHLKTLKQSKLFKKT